MLKTRIFERFVTSGEMTQRELASRIGVSDVHLSRIRHGVRSITPGFIAQACLAFGLPRDALFYDDAAPERKEAGTVAAPGGR